MNKKMWLTWLTASVVGIGTFAAIAEEGVDAPDKAPPPPRMREGGMGMGMEGGRMQDSPEFQAMRARRQEINKAMQAYRKLDDAQKPDAETKIKALLKTDLEAMLKDGKERLAKNRERLEKMEAELNKRAADIDTAVNEQFERMKEGKRPERGQGPGMFAPGEDGPEFQRDGKGPQRGERGERGERGNRPPRDRAPQPPADDFED